MNFLLSTIFLLLLSSLGKAEEAATYFRDQKHSTVKWGEVDIKSFLSLKDWRDLTAQRELVPEWEGIIRERNNREVVGYFLQCIDNCHIDRGTSFFSPSFRTPLYEGDEIQTIGESYAWIFLLDGTMVRLSPNSSMNINEFNIGIKENFINVRINTGNILWLSRSEILLEEQNTKETDVLFFPSALYEAQIVPDRKKYDEDSLIDLIEEKQSVLKHYMKLNQMIVDNNKMTKSKKTYSFIVAPNMTIMGYDLSVELISLMGGKTYFKKRSPKLLGLKGEVLEEDTYIQMRGFENTELSKVESDKWLEVDEKGRSLNTLNDEDKIYFFAMGEFITKHIPTILMARELMLAQYSELCFREKYNLKQMAELHGYRVWGQLKSDAKKEDLELRLDFLKEYFRRVETTNLLSSSHFRDRLKARGEVMKSMEYDSYFFLKALNAYYSYVDVPESSDNSEVLNSTSKTIWKRMHGIR